MVNGVEAKACFCVGPQNGEPLCPCEMKNVTKINGRWIQPSKDLGPVLEDYGSQLKDLL